ncbi:hypothetical protein M9458_055390, partial [Cirrhinus mrigala]
TLLVFASTPNRITYAKYHAHRQRVVKFPSKGESYHWFMDLLEAQPPESLKASTDLSSLTLFTLFTRLQTSSDCCPCGGIHGEPEPAQGVPGGPDRPNIQSCGSRPQSARQFHSTLEFIFMTRLSQSVVLGEPKKMS